MRSFALRVMLSAGFVLVLMTGTLILWLTVFDEYAQRTLLLIVMLTGMGIYVLVSTVMQYFFVIKPVNSIVIAARQLSMGEYRTRIKIGKYESKVQDVATSFNKIAAEFENLEEMRKSFVASASHELRSPLASIQGFLQAVLDGTIEGDEEREKYLRIVYNETKRLASLINNMLDLSRMESGNTLLSLTKFEINELIKNTADKFTPTLTKAHTKLKLDFAKDVVYVHADRDKIMQVLINLVDNAIKYSPAFSEVYINTYTQNKKLYVAVKDNGFGIAKKDQPLIWDKFYMADKARTPSKSRGTGLGLSIVKKIVDEHKEIIWVESDKGKGATFIFTLPIFDSIKHKVKDVPNYRK